MRAFVAIDLPADTRSFLAAHSERLKSLGMKLTWVQPEQMHITVKFFGELNEDDAPSLTEALKTIAATAPAFSLGVGGIGTFPPAGRVNVVWIGVQASMELSGLHQQCDDVLSRFGSPPEDRPFAPHLTLGRNKDHSASRGIRSVLADYEIGEPCVARVAGMTLYESILDRTGPTHRVISKHPFAG